MLEESISTKTHEIIIRFHPDTAADGYEGIIIDETLARRLDASPDSPMWDAVIVTSTWKIIDRDPCISNLRGELMHGIYRIVPTIEMHRRRAKHLPPYSR